MKPLQKYLYFFLMASRGNSSRYNKKYDCIEKLVILSWVYGLNFIRRLINHNMLWDKPTFSLPGRSHMSTQIPSVPTPYSWHPVWVTRAMTLNLLCLGLCNRTSRTNGWCHPGYVLFFRMSVLSLKWRILLLLSPLYIVTSIQPCFYLITVFHFPWGPPMSSLISHHI